jgi:hypothetical protein
MTGAEGKAWNADEEVFFAVKTKNIGGADRLGDFGASALWVQGCTSAHAIFHSNRH